MSDDGSEQLLASYRATAPVAMLICFDANFIPSFILLLMLPFKKVILVVQIAAAVAAVACGVMLFRAMNLVFGTLKGDIFF